MRVYFTTTEAGACAILTNGLTAPTWLADGEDGAGIEGNVVLCLDMADFARYEQAHGTLRVAFVPADVLNRLGPPSVYNHLLFSGWSRREMIAAIRSQVADGYSSADDMRAAIRLFDRIGWLAPLKQRDSAPPADPSRD
jgi:hypothetical protein